MSSAPAHNCTSSALLSGAACRRTLLKVAMVLTGPPQSFTGARLHTEDSGVTIPCAVKIPNQMREQVPEGLSGFRGTPEIRPRINCTLLTPASLGAAFRGLAEIAMCRTCPPEWSLIAGGNTVDSRVAVPGRVKFGNQMWVQIAKGLPRLGNAACRGSRRPTASFASFPSDPYRGFLLIITVDIAHPPEIAR